MIPRALGFVFLIFVFVAFICGPRVAAAATTTTTLAKSKNAPTTKTVALARGPMTEAQKVDWLIQSVKDSGLGFIRNGSQYDSLAAADHLTYKREHGPKSVKTARDFIKYLASGSSMSGKPYQIVLKDGKKVNSGDWLTARLDELEGVLAALKPTPTPEPKKEARK